MRGVSHNSNLYLLVSGMVGACQTGTQVVLDIPSTLTGQRSDLPVNMAHTHTHLICRLKPRVELTEDLLKRFTSNIG